MELKSQGLCKLCLQNKKLIKAHIIPEGFFRPLRSGNLAPEMHTSTPGSYPKRSPIGVYDPSILCSECDQKMAPWDDYAQELLIHQFSAARRVVLQGQTVARRIDKFDYRKLKLFFLSLLWRASISSDPFYKRISLGPFEEQLRTMILAEQPGGQEDFAVILARFEEPEFPAMLDPHPEKFDSISFCRFYLTGSVAYIKVDQRPTPNFLTDVRLRENAPLTVLARSLRNSTDGQVLRNLAESAIAHKRVKSKPAKDRTN